MNATQAVNEIAKFNFTQFFYSFFVLIVSITVLVGSIGLFSDKVLKKPFKWWQKLNRDHKLLEDVIKEMKSLSDRHEKDMASSDTHDKKIEETLDKFIQEVRTELSSNKDFFKKQIDTMTNKLREERLNERTHDRGQSFEREKRLKKQQEEDRNRTDDKFDKLSNSVNKISKKLDQMKLDTDERFQENEKRQAENEKKQNEKERNKIKAEISSRYIMYHERQEITQIEFEALQGLIKNYEAADGKNSFVHSKVEPEMYTWKRIQED